MQGTRGRSPTQNRVWRLDQNTGMELGKPKHKKSPGNTESRAGVHAVMEDDAITNTET